MIKTMIYFNTDHYMFIETINKYIEAMAIAYVVA